MRSATNTVLGGMAACDLVTIILPLPWHFQLYTLGHHQDFSWDVTDCYLFEFMCETVPQMFHTSSNWLTLGILLLIVTRIDEVLNVPQLLQLITGLVTLGGGVTG